MRPKVHFVIEPSGDLRLRSLIDWHLNTFDSSISERLPEKPHDFHLIVLWNLRRLIRDLPSTRNVVVFHSSDLPKGRGWAPIYHALAENREEHVVTAILAGPQVDAGEVIAKARFRIQPCHVADTLREIDEEVCIRMTAAILERYDRQPFKSVPQQGEISYYKRRSPQDSELNIQRPLVDLIPHMRGCGNAYPAYFDWHGCRYRIVLIPERTPEFPNDLRIEFADTRNPS